VNSGAATLAIRIRSELIDITQVVERTQRLMAKAIQNDDDDYYDGVALNLHSFYTAIERILEDIAREIDGAVPSGPGWHRDLLTQLSADFPGIRPAVLKHSSRSCLDEYRGLRHVIRNLYSFNLNPLRLQELVTVLPACHSVLVQDLEEFCIFLAALD
jgi:hypothetical protein